MRKMLTLVVFAAVAAALYPPAGQAESDVVAMGVTPAGHCAPDEVIVFTCPVAGRKHLSVCASKEHGPDHGYLQYRYGGAGKLELTLPKEKTTPPKSAKGRACPLAGGGFSYMQFTNGNTDYYVYSGIGKWGLEAKHWKKPGWR